MGLQTLKVFRTIRVMSDATPPSIAISENDQAALLHASGLLAYAGFPLVGPLVFWLVQKDKSKYLDFHGREAINFNLSFLIYGLVAAAIGFIGTAMSFLILPLVLVFLGWLGAVALTIAHIVFSIIGALEARKGVRYRFPYILRLLQDPSDPRPLMPL